LATDAEGNVYVVGYTDGNLYKITPCGDVSTLATELSLPTGVVVDGDGNAYVSSRGTQSIIKVEADGTKSTLATGFDPNADPYGIAYDATNDIIYAIRTIDNRVDKVSTADGTRTELPYSFSGPRDGAVDANGVLYVLEGNGSIYKIENDAKTAVFPGGISGLNGPYKLDVTPDGGILYVSNTGNGTVVALKVDENATPATPVEPCAAVVTSWEIGAVNPEDVVATFDPQTGVLTISGTGDMINFPAIYGDLGYVGSGAPWIATLEYEADGTTLKSITPYAYSNDITSVVIESGVTNIGSNFGWDNNANALTSLTSVTIGEDVVTIGSRAFNGVPLTGSIVIPEGVTTIGSYAFDDNGKGSVTSLTLPSTWVPTAAHHIFDNLNLDEIYISATTPPAFGSEPAALFTQTTYDNATLYVPADTKADYEVATVWSKFANITEVTAIGTVEAPKAIKSIKYYDLLGRPTTKSAKGIIFQEILYEDGTKAFRKTLVLEK